MGLSGRTRLLLGYYYSLVLCSSAYIRWFSLPHGLSIAVRSSLLPLNLSLSSVRLSGDGPSVTKLGRDRIDNRKQTMATEEEQATSSTNSDAGSSVSLAGRIENRYRMLKEHAETYPYVWASYIIVYGGFALWTTYRWRKLRNTETRVRALQERLKKIVEAEESASKAANSTEKPSASHVSQSSADKLPK